MWLDHHIIRLRDETRPKWEVLAGAAIEIRWLTRLTTASAAARIDHARPYPLSDRTLFYVLLATALGALAVAGLLGFALAQWALTRSTDLLPASGGALVVGGAFLALMFVVFASRDREPAEERQ